MKAIVQFIIDYPIAIVLFLIGATALTIGVACFNQWWDDRKTDANLPSYMRAYDKHGNRIKRRHK